MPLPPGASLVAAPENGDYNAESAPAKDEILRALPDPLICPPMEKAFVLGAGLGTRLKALTERLPKPLIPVHQKPLATYALDHLLAAGFREFIVNTHHRPDAWGDTFPTGRYRDCPLTFRHEPDILETAGGIANIAGLVAGEDFAVYNGDILTDLPLEPALEAHRLSGNLVTLILRTSGPALHIAWDAGTGKVLDIHNRLQSDAPHAHQFTGIYLVAPAFLSRLTPGKKESVIPRFLDLIRDEGALGAVRADEGHWWDLGDRDAYLDASAALAASAFPAYGRDPAQQRIHPGATIHPGAQVCALSSLADGTIVETGAVLENSILWPGARVTSGSRLRRCIVRDHAVASGDLSDADL